jgi:transposase InsO family protein
VTPPGSE